MAIKYLSINNDSIDFNNIPKLNTHNIFTDNITIDKLFHEYLIFNNASNNLSQQQNAFIILTENSNLNAEVVKSFLHLYYDTNNQSGIRIVSRKQLADSTMEKDINIGYSNSQQRFVTRCPDPISSANNTEIATTYWVRQLLASKGL